MSFRRLPASNSIHPAAFPLLEIVDYFLETPVPNPPFSRHCVEDLFATTELTFLTDDGLTVPGSEARFRIYALTATGNESGSETLLIERPED